MRTYFVSHRSSRTAPARIRSTSCGGTASGSRPGKSAASKASARFGLITVAPRQSTRCRGLGSAATILPAERASPAICENISVDKKPLPTEMFSQIAGDARSAGKIVAADPNPRHLVDWRGATVIKPNRAEALLAADFPGRDPD